MYILLQFKKIKSTLFATKIIGIRKEKTLPILYLDITILEKKVKFHVINYESSVTFSL